MRRPLSEGDEKKNLNPPNTSNLRPPIPGGSGKKNAIDWEPLTEEDLESFGRRIDSIVVMAPYTDHKEGAMSGKGGMYDQLSKLDKKHKGFHPIRGPVTIGGRLMMILIRPRNPKDDNYPNVWNRQEDDDDR